MADFGFSIYHRIHTDESGPGSIGYAAHIGGGAAGILVGINVLRNYIHKVHNYSTLPHTHEIAWNQLNQFHQIFVNIFCKNFVKLSDSINFRDGKDICDWFAFWYGLLDWSFAFWLIV